MSDTYIFVYTVPMTGDAPSSSGRRERPARMSMELSAGRRSFSGHAPDIAAVWHGFQIEQERCRSRFARLAKVPAGNAGLWLHLFNEALQVRILAVTWSHLCSRAAVEGKMLGFVWLSGR